LRDGNAARTRDSVPVILEVLLVVLAAADAPDLRCVTVRTAFE